MTTKKFSPGLATGADVPTAIKSRHLRIRVTVRIRAAIAVRLDLQVVDHVAAAGDFFSLRYDLLTFSFALDRSVQRDFAVLILHRHVTRDRAERLVGLQSGTNLVRHSLFGRTGARAALSGRLIRARAGRTRLRARFIAGARLSSRFGAAACAGLRTGGF